MKPGSRKSAGGSAPSMGGRGGSRHGAKGNAAGPSGKKVVASGADGTLSALPGRLMKKDDPSSYKSASSQGSSGPGPKERLAKAASGQPICGKAKP